MASQNVIFAANCRMRGSSVAFDDGGGRSLTLRAIRAIIVLERIANPEARTILETLAKGAPGALPTSHAQETLKRLAKPPVVAPH